MLVVIASRFDVDAVQLVERWHDRNARLLTCEGLSQRGWVLRSAAPDRSWAVLDGDRVPVTAIRGVVSRLPMVAECELPHILAQERGYVASEMTAFLLAWLSSLACPVLNRPTPLNLTGPSWYPEQWLRAAQRAGLRTRRMVRSVACFTPGVPMDAYGSIPDGAAEPTMSIASVGGRCLRDGDDASVPEDLAAGVRRLAAIARAELLTATFVGPPDEPMLCHAAPWVDLTRPEIADAVLARLGGAS